MKKIWNFLKTLAMGFCALIIMLILAFGGTPMHQTKNLLDVQDLARGLACAFAVAVPIVAIVVLFLLKGLAVADPWTLGYLVAGTWALPFGWALVLVGVLAAALSVVSALGVILASAGRVGVWVFAVAFVGVVGAWAFATWTGPLYWAFAIAGVKSLAVALALVGLLVFTLSDHFESFKQHSS